MRQNERGDAVLILTIGTLVVLGVSTLVSTLLPKTNQSVKTKAAEADMGGGGGKLSCTTYDQGTCGNCVWRPELDCRKNIGGTAPYDVGDPRCCQDLGCDGNGGTAAKSCGTTNTVPNTGSNIYKDSSNNCWISDIDGTRPITCPTDSSQITTSGGVTSCGQNRGAKDITGACNIACCDTNTDCPTGQVCGVKNEYCKSSTSCAGIPPGTTDNKPRYIRTCLGASCAWTWCDGTNYSSDHCVTDQNYPKSPSVDSLWCDSDTQCETFKPPTYGNVNKCMVNNQSYDCGPSVVFSECCPQNGKTRRVHRECTQSNTSGCVYWCEGPDKNKKYKCDDVANACTGAVCGSTANDLSVPTNGQRDGNCFGLRVETYADAKGGNTYQFNAHLKIRDLSPGTGKGHMWFVYNGSIEKPDVANWPGGQGSEYDLEMKAIGIDGPTLSSGASKATYNIRIPACGTKSQYQEMSCLYSIVNGKPKIEGPGCTCMTGNCTTESAAATTTTQTCVTTNGEKIPKDNKTHCFKNNTAVAQCYTEQNGAAESNCATDLVCVKGGGGALGDGCIAKVGSLVGKGTCAEGNKCADGSSYYFKIVDKTPYYYRNLVNCDSDKDRQTSSTNICQAPVDPNDPLQKAKGAMSFVIENVQTNLVTIWAKLPGKNTFEEVAATVANGVWTVKESIVGAVYEARIANPDTKQTITTSIPTTFLGDATQIKFKVEENPLQPAAQINTCVPVSCPTGDTFNKALYYKKAVSATSTVYFLNEKNCEDSKYPNQTLPDGNPRPNGKTSENEVRDTVCQIDFTDLGKTTCLIEGDKNKRLKCGVTKGDLEKTISCNIDDWGGQMTYSVVCSDLSRSYVCRLYPKHLDGAYGNNTENEMVYTENTLPIERYCVVPGGANKIVPLTAHINNNEYTKFTGWGGRINRVAMCLYGPNGKNICNEVNPTLIQDPNKREESILQTTFNVSYADINTFNEVKVWLFNANNTTISKTMQYKPYQTSYDLYVTIE